MFYTSSPFMARLTKHFPSFEHKTKKRKLLPQNGAKFVHIMCGDKKTRVPPPLWDFNKKKKASTYYARSARRAARFCCPTNKRPFSHFFFVKAGPGKTKKILSFLLSHQKKDHFPTFFCPTHFKKSNGEFFVSPPGEKKTLDCCL
jgi:hypothetical protein